MSGSIGALPVIARVFAKTAPDRFHVRDRTGYEPDQDPWPAGAGDVTCNRVVIQRW